MKRKYRICGFGKDRDVVIEVDDVKTASDLFEMIYDSADYIKGYVMDNETGEILADFTLTETDWMFDIHVYIVKEW